VARARDGEFDVVVEVMGGAGGVARDLVLAGAKGKAHVVTANKALVAAHLRELARAFRRRKGKASAAGAGPTLSFEAAVAGGVPIIRAVRDSLALDTVTRVAGILNGTTNYILSAMAADGSTYAGALSGAQAAGFAEADPTADVDGHDAANKLIILTALGTGRVVSPKQVPTTGIRGVTDADFALAAQLGATIKLLGVAEVAPASAPIPLDDYAGSTLDMFVAPCVVPEASAVGATGGALNHVSVTSAAAGTTTYGGPGAGSLPTANSVVSDMLAAVMGMSPLRPFPRALVSSKDARPVMGRTPRRWLIRTPPDVMRKLLPVVWDSVSAVPTLPPPQAGSVMGVVVDDMTRADVTTALNRAIGRPPSVARSTIAVYPVMMDEEEDE
jgi:homoserine dehydrogenase